MERWEELYSNGAISISQYAEWLIREGKLPSDLNSKSQEAAEAVMKYREQNRIKLSTSSYDIMGNSLENKLIEVQAFFNKIKPIIIGKPIKQILCDNFYLREEDYKKNFIEYQKELNQHRQERIKQRFSNNPNTVYAEILHGGLIILKIGEQQLEFELWASWNFDIKLNSFLVRECFDVKDKTVEEVYKASGYLDVSSLYGNNLIEQKIIDVQFITNDNDIVEFVFKLENGNELHLYENTDEPVAELYLNENNKDIF